MAPYSVKVFADYHQFYVWDAGAQPAAPEDYSAEDVERRVKVAPHVIVVQPVRNMEVPVELEVHASDPGFDEAQWDHIVECSLDLPSGKLQGNRPGLDVAQGHRFGGLARRR